VQEITSLCSQLAYTYSANRRAAFPFKLMYTSLGGRTFAKLEGMTDAGYKRWAKTEWSHEGYEILWQTEIEKEACTSTERESTDSTKQNTVYLTADSEEELKELNSNETYIIGGLCDHNRYKVSFSVPPHGIVRCSQIRFTC
jgi:tRNA (guanine9-N1)-methyltransferase